MKINACWLAAILPIGLAMLRLECIMCFIAMEGKNMSSITRKIEKAIYEICEKHDVSKKDLLGRSRLPNIVRARHGLMQHMHFNLGMSYSKIGRMMERDHTSVMHACKKISGEISGIELKKERQANDRPISLIKVVAATPDYVILFGGKRAFAPSAKKGDCLATWADGKQEFISWQAAQEYASLLDSRSL